MQAYKHINKNKGNKELVIFHAASAGEFEQLKPILSKVNRDKYYILQTFFSPTVYNAEYQNSLFDSCCYHPFDLPFSALIFFYHFKPKKYIITRHDLWPHHIIISSLLQIQSILINANLYDESKRLNGKSVYFHKFIFNKFEKILVGSNRIAKLFISLIDENKIVITGDSRFDQVEERKKHNRLTTFNDWDPDKTIMFASIDESDISIIDDAFLKHKWSDEKLIIVPHEINNSIMNSIKKILTKNNMTFSLYSNSNTKSKCCIVDCVGILADLYKFSSISYIGGGFSAGVHSVIEPAVYANAVIHGPNIKILDEAIDMKQKKISTMIENGNQLSDALHLIQNKEALKLNQQIIKNYMGKKGNSSEKILNEIFN